MVTLEDIPLFLTPQQLADITGEHVGSIRRGILEGRIPADKVNGHWLVCRDVVFPIAMQLLKHGTNKDASTPMLESHVERGAGRHGTI